MIDVKELRRKFEIANSTDSFECTVITEDLRVLLDALEAADWFATIANEYHDPGHPVHDAILKYRAARDGK